MAKWGEGDPRWIVEERPDATNVNNWHWSEKNADAWSKAKFKVSLMIRVKDVLRLEQNFRNCLMILSSKILVLEPLQSLTLSLALEKQGSITGKGK